MLNPLDHPICFTFPGRLCVSAWIEHGPFAMYLIDALRPAILVELGTHYGYSYCAFCQAVQTLNAGSNCFAVDSWNGDQHAGAYGPEIFEELSGYHNRLYGDFSSLLRTSFDEALSQFANGSVDLLHIDGFHSYEAVRHDFESWLPKMSKRGVILFHDTNVRERNFGVWRFWSEIKQQYKSFEFVHGHGLGVLAVGEDLPAGIRPMLDANSEDIAKLRRFFSHLGKSLSARFFVEKLGQDLNQANARDAEQERKRVDLQALLDQRDEEALALAARVADREWHVESLAVTVAERDRHAEALSSRIAEREVEVRALTDRIAEAQAESATLAARVADREWHVESLAVTVAERDRVVESLTSRVAESEDQITGQDLAVADLMSQLADHDRGLAELAEQVSERDRYIASLDADIAERHEIITRMHGEANESHGLSEERHRQILRLTDHLGTIEASLTWQTAQSSRLAFELLKPPEHPRWDGFRRAVRTVTGLSRVGIKSIASPTSIGRWVVKDKQTRSDEPTSQPIPPPMAGGVVGESKENPTQEHPWTAEVVSRKPEGPMSFQGGKRR